MSDVEKNIINSINKNGFPEKRVNLPFKAIFDSCKKNSVKLSDVLDNLKSQEIYSEIGDEKILFYKEKVEPSFDIPPDFMKSAMDQMKNMDPEQLKELKKKVMKMSSDERGEMLNKAKDIF